MTPLRRTAALLAAAALGATTAGVAAAPGASAAATVVTAAAPVAAPGAVGAAGLSRQELKNRTAAVALLVGTFTRHHPRAYAMKYIDGTTYIQHNPLFGSGRDAFITGIAGYLQQYPHYVLQITRTVAQGDYVVVQGLAKTSPADRGTVEIDVFRFNKAGKIVEHWDALQPVAATSVNGNPQV